jgi:hypothetical protein
MTLFFGRSAPICMVLLALVGCAGIGISRAVPVVQLTQAQHPPVVNPQSALLVTSAADTGSGSLRSVLAAAGPGATVEFKLPNPSTITLTSGPIAIAKSLAIIGPGPSVVAINGQSRVQLFTVAKGISVTISGLTLENGAGNHGGAIANAGSLTIRADLLKNNIALGSGAQRLAVTFRGAFNPRPLHKGARAPVPPRSSLAAIPHATSSNAEGGAVYNTGSLSLVNATLANNSAGAGTGGAVYSAAVGKLIVAGGSFTGNTAAFGGAIATFGTAQLSNAALKANGGYPGTGSTKAGAYGYGAGLYVHGNTSIIGCNIVGNIAGGNSPASFGFGGAIAQYAGVLTVSQTTFATNVAGGGTGGSLGYGGAIFNSSGSVALSNNMFTGNRAGGDAFGYGGAIFAYESIVGSKNVFSNNRASGSGKDGYAYGGAIYAVSGLKLNSDSFSANDARGGSAALYGYSFGGALYSEGATILKSEAFSNNIASGGLAGSAQGGAIYVSGGTSSWSGVSFSGNIATATGTGSYAAGGALAAAAALTVSQPASFIGNSAKVSSTSSLGGVGGALAQEYGGISLTASFTNNNASSQGGAVWIDDQAKIANSLLSKNLVTAVQSAGDGGGGIFIGLGGVLTLAGSTLTENATKGSVSSTGGGGLFNAGVGKIENTTLTANQSSVDGGGLENSAAGNFLIANVTVYQNTAGGHGGSLKNLYSDSSMTIGASILAGGASPSGADDISNDGAIVSLDYNIVQSAVSGLALSGTTAHNLATDPQLSPLTNNGGPTETNADNTSSPGTQYVPYNYCLANGVITDQRAKPRNPVGKGYCDVGAYEDQNP